MAFALITVLLAAEPALPVRDVPQMDAEKLMRFIMVFQSHKDELKTCALKSPQNKRVAFTLIWDVAADGAVNTVGVDQAKFERQPTALCIARKMRTWKFAASEATRTDSLRFAFGGRAEDLDYFDDHLTTREL